MSTKNDEEPLGKLWQVVRRKIDEDAAKDNRTGTHIGPYVLTKCLGEGGFGVVYLAQQISPIEREVAIKFINPRKNVDPAQLLSRFNAERKNLEVLNNYLYIVNIFDAGVQDGQPYLVMEYVKERKSIAKYCKDEKLVLKAKLELFTLACRAVQYAHQKGIIHRDIKPSNVLVTKYENEDKPTPKIIDFGLSKAIGESLMEEMDSTATQKQTGDSFTAGRYVIGTIEYLSPEQTVPGSPADTRNDVYSLGVLLYELLTGKVPFDPERLKNAGHEEAFRIIREEAPPKPSMWIKQLKGDLDSIILKCLEKKPEKRYPTVFGLVDDINRFLKNEPVEARGPWSALYRIKKLHKRRRALIPTATAFMFLVATSITMIVNFALKERVAAKKARNASLGIASLLRDLNPSSKEVTSATSLRDRCVNDLQEARLHLYWLISEDRLTGAYFATVLGESFLELGQSADAVAMLEAARDILEPERGIDHPETLAAAVLLARAYLGNRQWAKALPLAERVFAMRRGKLGDDNAKTLECASLLAVSRYQVGKHEEGVAFLEKTVEKMKTNLGADNKDTITAQMRLSAMYRDEGKSDLSISLLELIMREWRLGKLAIMTDDRLVIFFNWSDSLLELGKADDVSTEIRGFLSRLKTDVGPDHSYTIKALSLLIEAYHSAKQYDEVRNLLHRWLQEVRAKAGPESTPVAYLLVFQGLNLLKQKQFVDAEPILRQSLNTFVKLKNDNGDFGAKMLLGEALLGQKKNSEAEPLLQTCFDAIDAQEEKLTLAEKAPYKRGLLASLARVAKLHEEQGDKAQSAAWYEKLETTMARWHRTRNPDR